MADGIVKLRGLPFEAGIGDFRKFFSGLEMKDYFKSLFDYQGRPTGECFVQFTTTEDAVKALEKNLARMGDRYIEVYPSSMNEAKMAYDRMYSLIDCVGPLRGEGIARNWGGNRCGRNANRRPTPLNPNAMEFRPVDARVDRPLCLAWTKGECISWHCRAGYRHYYEEGERVNQSSAQQGSLSTQRTRLLTSEFSSPYVVKIKKEIEKRKRIEVNLETGRHFSFDETVVKEILDLTGNGNTPLGQRVKAADVLSPWAPIASPTYNRCILKSPFTLS